MLRGSHVLLVKRILTTRLITLSVHLNGRAHTAGQLEATGLSHSRSAVQRLSDATVEGFRIGNTRSFLD